MVHTVLLATNLFNQCKNILLIICSKSENCSYLQMLALDRSEPLNTKVFKYKNSSLLFNFQALKCLFPKNTY
jgi:hypothetical protein